jgi:hypothetical protein
MSVFTTIFIFFGAFIFGFNTAGYALLPEKFPFNWYENVGWACFLGAIILWEIARK